MSPINVNIIAGLINELSLGLPRNRKKDQDYDGSYTVCLVQLSSKLQIIKLFRMRIFTSCVILGHNDLQEEIALKRCNGNIRQRLRQTHQPSHFDKNFIQTLRGYGGQIIRVLVRLRNHKNVHKQDNNTVSRHIQVGTAKQSF